MSKAAGSARPNSLFSWRGLPLLISVPLLLSMAEATAESPPWQKLTVGLYLGHFDPTMTSQICKHKIVILKMDPKIHSLKLLSASEQDRKPRTAKVWCHEFGLMAAINASMYQSVDPIKSTGYMRNFQHLNNSYLNAALGAFLCFNPVDTSLPQVQIVDSRLQKDWRNLIGRYNTVVQNYRMISDGKKRGWSQREEIYGSAAIGMDRDGYVLFILNRSPFSTHDLIHILLSLPIHIESAIYVEGGPEATLYFKINDRERAFTGICETGPNEQNEHRPLQIIPNVIGIFKK